MARNVAKTVNCVCPTCKVDVTMKLIGCGCSGNIRYFCEKCRKAYPPHRLEIKPI